MTLKLEPNDKLIEIEGIKNDDCLSCHEEVLDLGEEISVPTPHPQFQNCLQCHVSKIPAQFQTLPTVRSDWIGLAIPMRTDSSETIQGTPPTVPHRTFLRDRCLTCHHQEHPKSERRTSHPERSNCQQCHVTNKDLEF